MSRPPLLYQEGNCLPDMHSQLLKAREFPCAKPLPCNEDCKTASIRRLATDLQKTNSEFHSQDSACKECSECRPLRYLGKTIQRCEVCLTSSSGQRGLRTKKRTICSNRSVANSSSI